MTSSSGSWILKRNKILRGEPHNFTYKLLFNKDSVVDTYFPAPALFNVHNRGRYYVLESEARAHNAAVVAARCGLVHPHREPPWATTLTITQATDWLPSLAKSISLGEYVFPLTLHSCSHISFQLSVFTLFHCIIHVKFIFSLSSCVFEKLWENKKNVSCFFWSFFLD